ncbi:putative alpha/beta hydrolase family protein DUF2235 [Rhodovulum imhoffii]|uniref:Putative alpha/beta hydrolase family protein DUF2235 n=1 Tax=Rhodovulum imhoffii TaxID=365340 RepID=A0A2T5BW94_9RHOB|nr:DUF2235 domain-containing protein [Rhodovulum imhoffii]MBK5935120.1 hypothetical protein [Rhodovulum imhoffii]PTN03915.1 putative alpha/beta hydrolase family protein DUF2235 [Rhodovulum imhoffii]
MRVNERVARLLRRPREEAARPRRALRSATDHVILLDGTLGGLDAGDLTHVGRTYQLLQELPASAPVSVYYEAGIQWPDWTRAHHVASGRGINEQIRRAYGYLASRYRVGDRIFLMGYSRGAFAARSLAGVLDSVGLLKAAHATERNLTQAWRHYRAGGDRDAAQVFREKYCLPDVSVEMIGVWDTVKALGLRLPLLWMLTEPRHAFHNHSLGPVVRHGYHALALDETREAFEPVLWECPAGWHGHVVQMWFRGTHGDVGGQVGNSTQALPLAHIPLVWMLERAAHHDLPLPEGWRARFPCDVTAPSVGMMRGWGKFFWLRHRRRIGLDVSEALHPTARRSDDPPGSTPRSVDQATFSSRAQG